MTNIKLNNITSAKEYIDDIQFQHLATGRYTLTRSDNQRVLSTNKLINKLCTLIRKQDFNQADDVLRDVDSVLKEADKLSDLNSRIRDTQDERIGWRHFLRRIFKTHTLSKEQIYSKITLSYERALQKEIRCAIKHNQSADGLIHLKQQIHEKFNPQREPPSDSEVMQTLPHEPQEPQSSSSMSYGPQFPQRSASKSASFHPPKKSSSTSSSSAYSAPSDSPPPIPTRIPTPPPLPKAKASSSSSEEEAPPKKNQPAQSGLLARGLSSAFGWATKVAANAATGAMNSAKTTWANYSKTREEEEIEKEEAAAAAETAKTQESVNQFIQKSQVELQESSSEESEWPSDDEFKSADEEGSTTESMALSEEQPDVPTSAGGPPPPPPLPVPAAPKARTRVAKPKATQPSVSVPKKPAASELQAQKGKLKTPEPKPEPTKQPEQASHPSKPTAGALQERMKNLRPAPKTRPDEKQGPRKPNDEYTQALQDAFNKRKGQLEASSSESEEDSPGKWD
ncbi:MAG: hypothetical protein ACK5MA_04935 [Parachlamydiaceae bacterium]